jgi:NhaA family Na+:H+ antiporter
MSHGPKKKRTPIAFLFEYSGFLIAGAIAALIWANVGKESYDEFVHLRLFGGADHHANHDADHHPEATDEPTEEAKHGQDRPDGHPGEAEPAEHPKADDSHADAHTPAGSESHEDSETTAHADGESKENHAHPHEHEADAKVPEMPTGYLAQIFYRLIHRPDGDGFPHGITIHFFINDILMALFFAIAGKEVWEALLPGGPLSNPKKAATPLMATLGGILGPVTVYLGGAYMTGTLDSLGNGWAIPCATDIAFSYLVARLVFGTGHPAIAFLLLLAIADDAAGLVILAIFYPSKELAPEFLLLTAAAIGIAFAFRRMKLHSFWWYLAIPGTLCWISFDLTGIHPALGLVPIIPCLPHAHTDLGIYAREEMKRNDTLNEFEHWFKNPVEVILGLFSLVNAGVSLGGTGTGTWLVLAGLMLGKPIGITVMTFIAEKGMGLEMPAGMTYRHVVTLGMIAAIGFTVALFVSTAAYPGSGPVSEAVKMGALLSFAAAIVAPILARMLGVKPEPVLADSKETPEKELEVANV